MFRILACTILSSLLFTACTSSESTGPSSAVGATISATFVDAPVAGLNYSGPTYSGVTGKTGNFLCKLGEVVTFKLGDLTLGQAPCSASVFPMHVTGENSLNASGGAVAMGVLFKTLDTDPTDAVFTIPAAVQKMKFSAALDFSVFNSASDLAAFKNVLDEITSDAGLSIDSAAIQTDYNTTHAPAAVAELLSSLTNPAYVSVPSNIASYNDKYFFVIASLKAGNPKMCSSISRIYTGIGFTDTPIGTSTGYVASLFSATTAGITDNTVETKSLIVDSSVALQVQDSGMTVHVEFILSDKKTAVTGSAQVKASFGTCTYNVASIPSAVPLAPGAGALLTISDGPVYDFGDVNTGASVDKTFTIINSGNVAATSLSAFGLVSPFGFKGGVYPGTGGTCASFILPSGSCTVVVSYSPLTVGLHADTFMLNYSNGGTLILTASRDVVGVGLAPAPALLTISDGPVYDYGNVTVGNDGAQIFTVANTGAVSATAMNEGGLSAPFSFQGGLYPGTGGTCSSVLGAGSTCTMVVLFSPFLIGVSTDTITLDYNDGTGVQTATRDLTGTGN